MEVLSRTLQNFTKMEESEFQSFLKKCCQKRCTKIMELCLVRIQDQEISQNNIDQSENNVMNILKLGISSENLESYKNLQ